RLPVHLLCTRALRRRILATGSRPSRASGSCAQDRHLPRARADRPHGRRNVPSGELAGGARRPRCGAGKLAAGNRPSLAATFWGGSRPDARVHPEKGAGAAHTRLISAEHLPRLGGMTATVTRFPATEADGFLSRLPPVPITEIKTTAELDGPFRHRSPSFCAASSITGPRSQSGDTR